MPGFTAEHFFKMGLEVSESKEPGMEVATASFRMCLTVTLVALNIVAAVRSSER
jgi:hypothetical protein